MEFYTVEKLNDWYFKIKLPLADRQRCKYKDKVLKYIYSIGRYVNSMETRYLYQEEVSEGEFVFQSGFASFVYNEFYKELDQASLDLLSKEIFLDLKLPDFPNLYPQQNEDLKKLLTYKRGLFQTYTGYGKSEVIATLAYYLYHELHERVLIVTAGAVALDELRNRFYKRYGLDLDYFDDELDINAININGYLRSSQFDIKSPYWNHDFWILADEVEYCCTESAMELYESIGRVKGIYGFSATPDKKAAEPIFSRVSDEFIQSDKMTQLLNSPFHIFQNRQKYQQLYDAENDRVHDILGRNKYLVGYFGNTVVFKKPDNFNITLVDVTMSLSKDDIKIPEEYSYNEIIYNLFTEPRVCQLIESIAFKSGLTFIPMFRLEVIDFWLDNYFNKKDFLVLVISSRGYEIYCEGKLQGLITMEEMKRLVKLGVIGVVLGTRSSYGAMDLPELKRSILLYSKVANIVIQAIGRTARGGEFEVYNLAPVKNIPTYSKDYEERKNLIKSYYRDCNIVEVRRSENYYGQ